MVKLLCPATHGGAIIGKGGSVINVVCQTTGTSIKMSPATEYYPETTDRVVMSKWIFATIQLCYLIYTSKFVVMGSSSGVARALGDLVGRICQVGQNECC